MPYTQGIMGTLVYALRPRQHGQHFVDENAIISIKNSLKFVTKGPINNIPALVQIMAWRRPGDKPLFEAMMISLLTHICVTRPQWVYIGCHGDHKYMFITSIWPDLYKRYDCVVNINILNQLMSCCANRSRSMTGLNRYGKSLFWLWLANSHSFAVKNKTTTHNL